MSTLKLFGKPKTKASILHNVCKEIDFTVKIWVFANLPFFSDY